MKNRIETARAARARMEAAEKEAAAARREWEAEKAKLSAALVAARPAWEMDDKAWEAVTDDKTRMEAEATRAAALALQREVEAAKKRTEAARKKAASAPAAVEKARADYMSARAALLAVDFAALDGDEMIQLCAAAVEKAIQRRERETGQSAAVMREKYREDAQMETAARALEMLTGNWIDGETADGTPRAEMPLALFAAIAAGRALDGLIYADGGHNVKLTAREARDVYGDAKGMEDTSRAVITAAPIREPVAPAPESAAILADTLARILAHVDGDKARETAAALMLRIYGGETLTESAAEIGISAQYARRVWQAVCNAAAVVKVEDGETAELERLIEIGRAGRTNAERRAYSAAVAALARKLERETVTAPGAVKWTERKDPAAAALAGMTYRERAVTNYRDFATLARAIYDASRAE